MNRKQAQSLRARLEAALNGPTSIETRDRTLRDSFWRPPAPSCPGSVVRLDRR